MKIYCHLVALAAFFPNAAAFLVQAPSTAKTVSMNSFTYGNGDGNTATAPSAMDPLVTGGPSSARGPTSRPEGNGDGALIDRTTVDTSSLVAVQGDSLRTWAFTTPTIERVQVFLETDGRPLNANVELWQGPDNTPQKMGVYIEDGSQRPFRAVIETPRGYNAIAVRNTGQMEFPLAASVVADDEGSAGVGSIEERLSGMAEPKTLQGGAVRTYAFDPYVESVQVLLKTDGRPLNSRIELLQGPNNLKQVIEVYTEDGMERPFFLVFETPGTGNVVRIVNTATLEYPLSAVVEPYI